MDDRLKEVETHVLISKFYDIADELIYRERTSTEKLSFFSKRISEIQHEIESTPFDVFRGYKFAKSLQKFAMLRRKVKRDKFYFLELKNRANFDVNTLYDSSELFKKLKSFSVENTGSNYNWSNYEKLGDINYQEIEDEYNKQFGSLNDQLEKLKNHI
ncbi:hypothetical protein [Enterococcus sp. N249-2]